MHSTVCQGLLRLYLSVTITVSALYLQSCASTKTAAHAGLERQSHTEQSTGVSVHLAGSQVEPVQETAELMLPITALEALPEGAEYSHAKGNTRVAARRKSGDSVLIRATGLRQKTVQPDLTVTAQSKQLSEAWDSAAALSAGETGKPRGQPLTGRKGELLVIALIFLALIGIIVYESHKH